MAMVLTLESPKWWETSKTNLLSIPLTSRAFKIAGKGPLNWTSTTAPMTWEIYPTLATFGASLVAVVALVENPLVNLIILDNISKI